MPLNGFLLHTYGQKLSIEIALVVAFLSWMIMYYTPYVSLLILSRFTHGLSCIIITAACCLYVIETANEKIRNILIALVNTFRYIGGVFIYAIGYSQISWRLQALICCLIGTIPPFMLFMFFPTSPRYLARREKLNEAEKSLQFYRGKDYDIKTEMAMIKKVFLGEEKQTFKTQLHYLLKPKVFKYLMILFFMAFLTEVNGKSVILVYSGPIINEAIPEVDPYLWALVIAIMRVIGCSLFGFVTTLWSRRLVYLFSCLCTVASLTMFGTYLYYSSAYENTVFPWWVPIICLSSLMISTAISVPLAMMLIGEILPTNCRSLGYVIADVAFYITYFVLSLSFPWLKQAITFHGTVWLYAVIHFIVAWFPYLFLPETKDKNLEEIQMKLFS